MLAILRLLTIIYRKNSIYSAIARRRKTLSDIERTPKQKGSAAWVDGRPRPTSRENNDEGKTGAMVPRKSVTTATVNGGGAKEATAVSKAAVDATFNSHQKPAEAAHPLKAKPLKSAMRRSYWSTPNIPTAMRVQTLDESLHSTDLNRSRTRGKPGIDELSASRRGQQQAQAATDDASGSSKHSAISFSNVEMREYSRAVGDNPSVSAGPPMSIGWEYNDPDVLTIDEYESTRPPRRAHHEMVVPRSVRQDMLMNEWGYSRSQLAGAVRDSNRTKTQRRTTVNNMDTPFAKIEEGVQSAKRKMKRFVLRRKSDGAMYQTWKVEEMRARKMIEAENRATFAATGDVAGTTLDHSTGLSSIGMDDSRQQQGGGRSSRRRDVTGEEAKVEAEAGGDTFELISIDSGLSSPSDSGRHLDATVVSAVAPQALLPPAPDSPQVDEADRAASKPSSSSQSRHAIVAEEDDELEAALAGA